MQYHLNGFKPGDPDVLAAAPDHCARVTHCQRQSMC
jgi:hypothetical protein